MAKLSRFQHRHRAGALRNRVTLQALAGSTVAGSRGQSQKEWVDVDPVRVGIFTLSGREMELARSIVPTATHVMVTRYHAGVKPTARFVMGTSSTGRIFNIESVDHIEERQRWQDSICTEEVRA